jgi:hypothetical protein
MTHAKPGRTNHYSFGFPCFDEDDFSVLAERQASRHQPRGFKRRLDAFVGSGSLGERRITLYPDAI